MDPPRPSPFSNGGVSVNRKYSTSFMNRFLWYFFQTITVSSLLLMVLSIYYYAFAASGNNIRVIDVCVISVFFVIINPCSFIIPKLPQIAAAVAIPIIQQLNKNPYIRMLNIALWMVCGYGYGYVYPFPAHLSCYSLMAGVGLLKMYGDGGPASSLKLVIVIGLDSAVTSLYVFNHEIKRGTGRWVDSSTGWVLLGLFVVTMLALFLPPLVKPEDDE